MMRARAFTATVFCAIAFAGIARSTPPVPLDLAGFSLTIEASETFVAGVPIAVAGQLCAYAHLPIVFEAAQPVSDQDIVVYVDGVASTSARTDSAGSYSVTLQLGTQPATHSIRAVAFQSMPIETWSRAVATRLDDGNGR
jgi:hypothetical protein